MSLAADTDKLISLARGPQAGDRERLLLSIAELCASARAQASPPIQSLLAALVSETEPAVRRRIARRLAPARWATPGLMMPLALDAIEIAQPVIAASPALQDHHLIEVLAEGDIEHQVEVARRPAIGPAVVAAILQRGEPAVLNALAGNMKVRLSAHDMALLVEASEQIVSLRCPLARHPALDERLARRLHAWSGGALRQALERRFDLPSEAAPAAASAERRDEMERRLIAKLAAAGQLSPGYLLRALKEGRLNLFLSALAALGGFQASHVRQAVDSEAPELLGLACAAVGIDRSAFPAILSMVRQLNAGAPGGGQEGARRANGAFGPFDAHIAGAAFRQAVNAG
ncbi:DUF2336 domain-containing protein [Phenylobacterium koreense]|uniref:Uncharacterized protein (DUF2336 family) n=3 Tax=Phenylobacterium TaxID=20 RepID=A0ABV2ELH8_9CAUL